MNIPTHKYITNINLTKSVETNLDSYYMQQFLDNYVNNDNYNRQNSLKIIIRAFVQGHIVYKRTIFNTEIERFVFRFENKTIYDSIIETFLDYKNSSYCVYCNNYFDIRWSDSEWILIKLMNEEDRVRYKELFFQDVYVKYFSQAPTNTLKLSVFDFGLG